MARKISELQDISFETMRFEPEINTNVEGGLIHCSLRSPPPLNHHVHTVGNPGNVIGLRNYYLNSRACFGWCFPLISVSPWGITASLTGTGIVAEIGQQTMGNVAAACTETR